MKEDSKYCNFPNNIKPHVQKKIILVQPRISHITIHLSPFSLGSSKHISSISFCRLRKRPANVENLKQGHSFNKGQNWNFDTGLSYLETCFCF